jgi:copper(I)-binding protein
MPLFLLSACSKQELSVYDAWIPEAPAGVPALAGYVQIENGSAQTVTLMSASGPMFKAVELHRTTYEKATGLVRMSREAQLVIEPNGRVVLEPGGYHLMLVGPEKSYVEGDTVSLTLVFNTGSRKVNFQVRKERLQL